MRCGSVRNITASTSANTEAATPAPPTCCACWAGGPLPAVIAQVGAVLGIHPITVLLCFGIWFIVLMITHYVSLSSMIAGCCFPVFVLLSPKINHSVPLVVFSFVIAALLIWTHRKNIDRLKKGTESKIYIWRPVASRRRNDPDK